MKSILSLALSALLLGAPSKPAPTTEQSLPELMFAPFVVSEILELIQPDLVVSLKEGPEDMLYLSPTQKEIDEMIAFWKKNKFSQKYINEAWDCDDYAREFLYWARRWGVKHYDSVTAAVLVGKAYVKIDGHYDLMKGSPVAYAYHVVNVIRRSDGQWLFFEPQSGILLPVEGPILEGAVTIIKLEY